MSGTHLLSSADPHRVSWDQIDLKPVLQLKVGVTRQTHTLERIETGTRQRLEYANELVRLGGSWEDVGSMASKLSLRLTNIAEESIRITRLMFPAEAGISSYVAGFHHGDVCFFRNGYQGWSTARSYRPKDKPLRPWLQLVSLASSNLANLPSNVPGVFSSEMYTIITNRASDDAFLIGQCPPFDHFFYIQLNLHSKADRKSYFELTYDFGRKMIMPGETIELSGILIERGATHQLLHRYFKEIADTAEPRLPERNVQGWCSWYYYYTKISPQIIRDNIDALKRARDDHGAKIDFVQIDDGYQRAVGDWLKLQPHFDGSMRRLSDEIRAAGFSPGLWIAPFVAAAKSDLLTVHPEYALRDENGKRIVAGFNFFWPGRYYYGLDITNPRFEEYLRRVIKTVVGDWGFPYLKCDFLFGGCLRGGTHHALHLSRTEVLKRGMQIIREVAEANTDEEVFLVGCGMPLIAGIGTVDAMRIGPDTGGYWIERKGKLLRTGAMVGVRNSVRNSVVRGGMHRALWLNDPDCLMLRTEGTSLSAHQRRTQINAIALTGGLLLYSDDFSALDEELIREIGLIQRITDECFNGRLIPLDMMARELPSVIYNTSGYLGVFNMHRKKTSIVVEADYLLAQAQEVARIWGTAVPAARRYREVWTGQTLDLSKGDVSVGPLESYQSLLFEPVE
ncbi:MAG: alpha-galactosidase [Spirochaetaceae bacterium]|nr:MAG: alpha-galactosidase [Spirochaetaceae bacterium]